MAKNNFAPALFLIGGVIAVTLLAPKRKRGGTTTFQLAVTADMVRDACQSTGSNDPRSLSEYVAKVYYPEVPLPTAVEAIIPEMVRVSQDAQSFGLTLCDYAINAT